MNKEDSNEGPKIIEGFVHHNNDRFYGTPGIRVRVIEFGDAKWDTRDIPATLVIGSKAIPEGEVVKMLRQIQHAMVRDMIETSEGRLVSNPPAMEIAAIAKAFNITL